MTVIKRHIEVTIEPLCFINRVFQTGTFSDALKISLVIPCHKKSFRGSLKQQTDKPYNIIRKDFREGFSKSLSAIFRKFEVLSKNQDGLIQGRSTETAVFEFLQNILSSLEERDNPTGLFVDFFKTFDCVNHISLRQLERYGIRGMTLKLLGRKQVVILHKGDSKFVSSEKEIHMGVPQGTILGPYLFVVYIDDLSEIFD